MHLQQVLAGKEGNLSDFKGVRQDRIFGMLLLMVNSSISKTVTMSHASLAVIHVPFADIQMCSMMFYITVQPNRIKL